MGNVPPPILTPKEAVIQYFDERSESASQKRDSSALLKRQKAKVRQLSQTVEYQKAEYGETIRVMHNQIVSLEQENDSLRAEAAEWREERARLLQEIEESQREIKFAGTSYL